MSEGAAFRDGRIIYAWDTMPGALQERFNRAYVRPFNVVSQEQPACLSVYKLSLQPGEEAAFTFKMPHYPLAKEQMPVLRAADFSERLSCLEAYSDGLLGEGG